MQGIKQFIENKKSKKQLSQLLLPPPFPSTESIVVSFSPFGWNFAAGFSIGVGCYFSFLLFFYFLFFLCFAFSYLSDSQIFFLLLRSFLVVLDLSSLMALAATILSPLCFRSYPVSSDSMLFQSSTTLIQVANQILSNPVLNGNRSCLV